LEGLVATGNLGEKEFMGMENCLHLRLISMFGGGYWAVGVYFVDEFRPN